MNENTRNKPIALAITLVILVICLMLIIIFITKNIDYKQQLQVNTGKTIVSLLEDVKDQSYYIEEQLLNNGQLDQVEKLQQTNGILIYELTRLEHMIVQLYDITSPISSASLSSNAISGEVPKLTEMITLLEQQVGDKGTYDQLLYILDNIQASTEKFNYKLKGVKTAMIRMSNGFEWTEAVHALDNATKID